MAENTNTNGQSPASESRSSSADPIRCGVIGLGRIGWDHHCQIIHRDPRFKLAGVCDAQESRLEEAQQATGCRTYSRFEELLKDAAVELIVVASPSIEHEPMAIQALGAGKHVVVEKPAAQSAPGIRRMMAAARDAGQLLTMHHNYRWNPEFLYIREIIQSGVLGQVFRIKRRVQSFSRRNDWQTLRKYGGGMTGNWGIHLVDSCLCLLDSDVAEVWGDVKQVFNPGDAEDDIKAIIRGKSGMTLDIDMTSVNAAPEPSWVVMGNCGTLWSEGGKAHLKYFDPQELPPLEANDLPYAVGRRYGVSSGEDPIPWNERGEPMKPREIYPSYYDILFEAVRENGEPPVTVESALQTYQVLDDIRKGSRFAPEE